MSQTGLNVSQVHQEFSTVSCFNITESYHVKINDTHEDDLNLLMVSVLSNQMDVALKVFSSCYNWIRAINKSGRSVLSYAVMAKNYAFIDYLLKEVDWNLDWWLWNVVDEQGLTPLQMMISVPEMSQITVGLFEVAPELLNYRTDYGWNVLHFACYIGNYRLAQVLSIMYPQLVIAYDVNMNTPLHVMITYSEEIDGLFLTLKLTLPYALNLVNENDFTVLENYKYVCTGHDLHPDIVEEVSDRKVATRVETETLKNAIIKSQRGIVVDMINNFKFLDLVTIHTLLAKCIVHKWDQFLSGFINVMDFLPVMITQLPISLIKTLNFPIRIMEIVNRFESDKSFIDILSLCVLFEYGYCVSHVMHEHAYLMGHLIEERVGPLDIAYEIFPRIFPILLRHLTPSTVWLLFRKHNGTRSLFETFMDRLDIPSIIFAVSFQPKARSADGYSLWHILVKSNNPTLIEIAMSQNDRIKFNSLTAPNDESLCHCCSPSNLKQLEPYMDIDLKDIYGRCPGKKIEATEAKTDDRSEKPKSKIARNDKPQIVEKVKTAEKPKPQTSVPKTTTLEQPAAAPNKINFFQLAQQKSTGNNNLIEIAKQNEQKQELERQRLERELLEEDAARTSNQDSTSKKKKKGLSSVQREKIKKERKEAEKREKEEREKERKENERREREERERERKEAEQREKEISEAKRREKERIEAEKREEMERERKEVEQREMELVEKREKEERQKEKLENELKEKQMKAKPTKEQRKREKRRKSQTEQKLTNQKLIVKEMENLEIQEKSTNAIQNENVVNKLATLSLSDNAPRKRCQAVIEDDDVIIFMLPQCLSSKKRKLDCEQCSLYAVDPTKSISGQILKVVNELYPNRVTDLFIRLGYFCELDMKMFISALVQALYVMHVNVVEFFFKGLEGQLGYRPFQNEIIDQIAESIQNHQKSEVSYGFLNLVNFLCLLNRRFDRNPFLAKFLEHLSPYYFTHQTATNIILAQFPDLLIIE